MNDGLARFVCTLVVILFYSVTIYPIQLGQDRSGITWRKVYGREISFNIPSDFTFESGVQIGKTDSISFRMDTLTARQPQGKLFALAGRGSTRIPDDFDGKSLDELTYYWLVNLYDKFEVAGIGKLYIDTGDTGWQRARVPEVTGVGATVYEVDTESADSRAEYHLYLIPITKPVAGRTVQVDYLVVGCNSSYRGFYREVIQRILYSYVLYLRTDLESQTPQSIPNYTLRVTPTELLESQLESKLYSLESRYRKQLTTLTPIKRTLPDGSKIDGYEVGEVRQLFTQSKTELLQELNDAEFAGLRSYVKHYYPSIKSLATVQAFTFHYPPSFGNSRSLFNYNLALRQESIVPKSNLDIVVNQVLALFSTLKKNKKAVDIKVVSVPDGARVELTADGGNGRKASTDSQISNIFRGLYHFTITRDGFNNISTEFNLIDERGTTIVCTLSKTETGSCSIR